MDNSKSPGIIEPGCLYSADEARCRLRIGSKTWKDLRNRGLPVRFVGGRHAYVLGDDLIEALKPRREASLA
jgi:hypothetical protein